LTLREVWTRALAVALGLMVSIAAPPAHAAQVQIVGPGNKSCGAWTADRTAQGASVVLVDEAWVVGYLSGVAFWGGLDPMKGLDTQAVFAWLDNYCRAHPLTDIIEAANAFVHEHPGR
jgi:hypothetical protein